MEKTLKTLSVSNGETTKQTETWATTPTEYLLVASELWAAEALDDRPLYIAVKYFDNVIWEGEV